MFSLKMLTFDQLDQLAGLDFDADTGAYYTASQPDLLFLQQSLAATDNEGNINNELPKSPRAPTLAQSNSVEDHFPPVESAIGAYEASAIVLATTANPLLALASVADIPGEMEECGMIQISRTNATNTAAMARRILRRLRSGSR